MHVVVYVKNCFNCGHACRNEEWKGVPVAFGVIAIELSELTPFSTSLAVFVEVCNWNSSHCFTIYCNCTGTINTCQQLSTTGFTHTVGRNEYYSQGLTFRSLHCV